MTPQFFQKQEILSLLNKTITVLYDSSETPTPIFTSLLIQMLQTVHDNAKSFDDFCHDSLYEFNSRVENALVRVCVDHSNEKYKFILFEFFHRFICEHAFRSRYNHRPDSSFNIRSDILKNITKLPVELQSEIIYDNHAMPALWLNNILTSDNFKKAEEFLSKTETFDAFINKAVASLDSQVEKVTALKDNLQNYQTAFNFVGLHKGFHNLKESKLASLKWNKVGLYSLGVALILSVGFGFYYAPEWELQKLPKILSAIGLDILLAYYFRIFLLNFNKIKDELSSVELRMTLCQFIQSYAEFAKEINSQSPKTLDKFDSLIFSSLASTGTNQSTTTFDGVDQLAKLIDAIKTK